MECRSASWHLRMPGGRTGMVYDNPWFLITDHEIDEIQERVHCLEGELPCTSRHQAREILTILKDVRDR